MTRDGTIYRDFNTAPKPPAHFNCRSDIVPVVKPELDIGRDIVGTRPSATGEVKANLTYSQWLKRQPPEFQDEVLGKVRAKLFRDGRLPLDRFVDDCGNTLTLAELIERDNSLADLIPLTP